MKEISELYGGLSQVCADWERVHKIQRNTFFKNFRNMFGTSLYEEQGLEAVRLMFPILIFSSLMLGTMSRIFIRRRRHIWRRPRRNFTQRVMYQNGSLIDPTTRLLFSKSVMTKI
jgi:hypothetical protein